MIFNQRLQKMPPRTPNKSPPGSVTPGAPTKSSLMHRGEGEPSEPANLCRAFDSAADKDVVNEVVSEDVMDEDVMNP